MDDESVEGQTQGLSTDPRSTKETEAITGLKPGEPDWRRRRAMSNVQIRSVGLILTRTVLRLGVAGLVVLALTSCNFDVSNPGPVQDQNLDDSGAHEPLVTGTLRGTLNGWSDFGHRGGAISRDHTTGGHVFAGGIPLEEELGQLSDIITANNGWNRTHQGRWIGEQSAARIRKNMGAEADSYSALGRLSLWAGFANRVLGEHVCTAVIDGSAVQPYATHFTRAIEYFTAAEKIASATGENEVKTAAIAGKAAALLSLGKYAEAATEAAKVPFNFTFAGKFTGRGASDLGNDGEKWRITLAMQSQYRGVSFWHTPFEKHFLDTGDPRVAWGHDTKFKYAPVPRPTWGQFILYYYPLKFYAPRFADERTQYKIVNAQMDVRPVNLATGREMVLIRAEAALAQGKWQDAMTLINQVRTSAFDRGTGKSGSYFTGKALEPVTATTLEQAWAALKYERLLELTLEGRRFGDRKRWAASKTPGALHPYEFIPDEIVKRYGVPNKPDLCFPIPLSEKQANANIPEDYKDTKVSDRS